MLFENRTRIVAKLYGYTQTTTATATILLVVRSADSWRQKTIAESIVQVGEVAGQKNREAGNSNR